MAAPEIDFSYVVQPLKETHWLGWSQKGLNAGFLCLRSVTCLLMFRNFSISFKGSEEGLGMPLIDGPTDDIPEVIMFLLGSLWFWLLDEELPAINEI